MGDICGDTFTCGGFVDCEKSYNNIFIFLLCSLHSIFVTIFIFFIQ